MKQPPKKQLANDPGLQQINDLQRLAVECDVERMQFAGASPEEIARERLAAEAEWQARGNQMRAEYLARTRR